MHAKRHAPSVIPGTGANAAIAAARRELTAGELMQRQM
jgi:hypothetical protein